MSESIGRDELIRLTGEMEPEEVEATYAPRFDEEASAYFEEFKHTCRALENLNGHLESLTPPMPEASPRVVPLYRRMITLPSWSVPLAAAAVLMVGVALPSMINRLSPEKRNDTLRSRPMGISYEETPTLNGRIADALYARGKKLQEQQQFERAWTDYELALDYLKGSEPTHQELILDEMRIVAEQLTDSEKLAWLEQRAQQK